MADHESDPARRLERKIDRLTILVLSQLVLWGGFLLYVAPGLALVAALLLVGLLAAIRWLPDAARIVSGCLAAFSARLQSMAGGDGSPKSAE